MERFLKIINLFGKQEKNLEKEKKNILSFSIILIITLIIFIPFLTGHYATDTYKVGSFGYRRYALQRSLKDGRLIMCGITLLAEKLNLSIEMFVFITLFFALIVSSIAVVILKKIIQKYKKKETLHSEIIVGGIAYITIFNHMYIECMYFVECFVMAMSVLLFLISANILVERKKNSFYKAILLAILGTFCYQGAIGLFFVYTLMFSILKNDKDVKKIIVDMIKSVLIIILSMTLNLFEVKIVEILLKVQQGRIGGIGQIWTNIKKIIYVTPYILRDSCGLYPQYLYLTFIFAILGVTVLLFKKDKKNLNIIIKLLVFFIMSIIASSILFVLAYTSVNTGRLRLPTGITIGVFFIILYVQTNIFEEKRIFKIIGITLLIIYILVTIIFYEYLMIEHIKVNFIEKNEVAEICRYIDEYEEKNNIKVNKIIRVYVPSLVDYEYYLGIKNHSVFTCGATKSYLTVDAVINHYTDRGLKNVGLMNMRDFKIQQDYLCLGDTLYIKVI